MAIEDLLDFALASGRYRPNTAIIGPSIDQAVDIYWDRMLDRFSDKFYADYVKDRKGGPEVVIARPYMATVDEHENILQSPSTIRLFGVENGTAIEGQALDYALCDEVGLWKMGVLKTSVEPATNRKKGFMRLYGTPRGDNDLRTSYISYNDFMTMGNQMYFSTLRTVYNVPGAYTKEEADEIRADYIAQGKLHLFNMAYMCDFYADIAGAVYSKGLAEARAHNKVLPLLPQQGVPIHTVWDIGLSYTSCWVFQFYNDRYYILKHWEWKDTSIEECVPEVRDSGYQFANHWLPHDALQRNRNNKRTYKQDFEHIMQHNGQTKTISKVDHEETRTQISRNLFHQCYFDVDGCKRGLELLAQYKLKTDPKSGYVINKIVKDKYSHTGDAFAQMFMIPRMKLQSIVYGDIMNRMHIGDSHPFYEKKGSRTFKQGQVGKFGELYPHKKRGF